MSVRVCVNVCVMTAALGAVVLWWPPSPTDFARGPSASPAQTVVPPRATIAAAEVPGSFSERTDAAGFETPTYARAIIATPSTERTEHSTAPGQLVPRVQRELARLGCYGGEIDGDWGPASKRAMAAFLARANAALPIDRPDDVLLALLRNYKGASCKGTLADSSKLAGSRLNGTEQDTMQQPAQIARAGSDLDGSMMRLGGTNPALRAQAPRRTNTYSRPRDTSWRQRAFEPHM
jgi:peptidoglycan hydrolase-like protein with peptidoglycan-binding domain